MAFGDPNSFVAPAAGGGFMVVTPGAQPQTYASQSAAEQAYNTAMGLSNGPAASGGYPVMGGGYGLDLAGMWANQAAQNQLARDRFNQLDIPSFQWQKALGGMAATGYYRDDNGNLVPASYGAAGATPTFDTARYYSDLLNSKTGPREYWQYQSMLAGRPGQSLGGMADIFRAQKPWGAVQATPSWEQMAAQYNATGSVAPQAGTQAGTATAATPSQANGWGIPTDVLQPHKLTAQQLGNMSGTQREMQSGLWSAQGLDPNDMWQRAARAQPQGQAAKGTTWRGTW